MEFDLNKIEPVAAKTFAGGEVLMLMSIAVSLKRIADEMQKARATPRKQK